MKCTVGHKCVKYAIMS